MKNGGKVSELKVQSWFLAAGWPVFCPVVEIDQVDIIVEQPQSRLRVAIQVKHSEPGCKNPGYLDFRKKTALKGFDYLVFHLPEFGMVVILPHEIVRKRMVLCNRNHRGRVERRFKPYACREDQFIAKFEESLVQTPQ
jgi:hypothetical protein